MDFLEEVITPWSHKSSIVIVNYISMMSRHLRKLHTGARSQVLSCHADIPGTLDSWSICRNDRIFKKEVNDQRLSNVTGEM